MRQSFHMLEVPNGNDFALVDSVYAPCLVHHRWQCASNGIECF